MHSRMKKNTDFTHKQPRIRMKLFVSITALTVLASVIAIEEFNTEENATGRRHRRNIGQLQVGRTAFAYMTDLLEKIADENYVPKDYERNPTSVWCFFDADVTSRRHRIKPTNEEKCSSLSRFILDWEIDPSTNIQDISLTRALFRPYMQVIGRRIQSEEPIKIDFSVSIRQFGHDEGNFNYSIGHLESLNVTSESDGWLELDITDTLRKVWPPSEDIPYIEIIFKMMVNCQDQKKVPITLINPAEIPLSQTVRRERYLELQPLFVVSADNDQLKSMIQDEKQEHFDDSAISNRRKRHANSITIEPEICRLENYTISFADLNLNHIVEPKRMNIQHCNGACTHDNMKLNKTIATSHAKLMASAAREYYQYQQLNDDLPANNTIVHSSEPRVPCCVPITYESVYLMILQLNSLELKLFPDLVATECECR